MESPCDEELGLSISLYISATTAADNRRGVFARGKRFATTSFATTWAGSSSGLEPAVGVSRRESTLIVDGSKINCDAGKCFATTSFATTRAG